MKSGRPDGERREGFVMLPRSVVDRMVEARLSAAAFRVLVFLMRELLRYGGKGNGQLKAPHRQLIMVGVNASSVSSAIRELEAVGLVRCHRKGKGATSLFELAWLPIAETRIGKHAAAATMNGGRVAI
jgi:hypothetical protein